MGTTRVDNLLSAFGSVTLDHRILILRASARDGRQTPRSASRGPIVAAEIEHHMTVAQIARLADRVAGKHIHRAPAALPHDLKSRLMNQVRMITVDRVLDLELPVARVAVFVHAGAYVELALGRQIDKQVDLIPRRTEMFIERDSVRRETAEYKPAIDSHSWNVSKAQLFLAQRSAIAVLVGNGTQLTVVAISPAVIRASENLRVALGYLTYGSRPMAASVQQQAHLATIITHHDHGCASDLSQPVVTRLRNLAGVPHVDPSSMKDFRDLVFEDLGIEID